MPQNRRKQANRTSWHVGQSGNPGGRPKDYPGFREWCQQFMAESGRGFLQDLAESAEPRTRAIVLRLLAEYAYGKAPERVEISGEVTHRYLATFDSTDSDLSASETEQSRPEVRH